MSASGQFGQFSPSRLSDRNGFVEETLAGTGVTDGNAPLAEERARLTNGGQRGGRTVIFPGCRIRPTARRSDLRTPT